MPQPLNVYPRRGYYAKRTYTPGLRTATQNMMATGVLRRHAVNAIHAQMRSRNRPKYRPRYRTRTKPRYAQGNVNRRKTVTDRLGSELTTRTLQIRAPSPKLTDLMRCCMQPQYYRVQGITPFDTTNGFYACANRVDANGVVGPPVHIWDMTCIANQVGGSGGSLPNVGYQLIKTAAAADADVGRLQLPSIGSAGTLIPTNSALIVENSSSGNSGVTTLRAAFHEWTHIKMNLYGVRSRGTRWVIELVQVTDQFADPITAAGSNREFKKLLDYWARPMMVSNINSGDPLSRRYVKTLKKYSVVIDPIQTIEYGGDTGTPHIHTLNWFIKHNRLRKYDWFPQGDPGLSNGGQFDVDNAPTSDRVHPRKRLYLLVRALSPSQRTVAANTITSADADEITEPSYDLVMRQKFRTPITL